MHKTLHYYSFFANKNLTVLQSYSPILAYSKVKTEFYIYIYIDIEHFFDKCITLFLDCKTVRCKDVRVIC